MLSFEDACRPSSQGQPALCPKARRPLPECRPASARSLPEGLSPKSEGGLCPKARRPLPESPPHHFVLLAAWLAELPRQPGQALNLWCLDLEMFMLRNFEAYLLFRWRPYRVECTGSLLTSEVKRHRARSVLGWGAAWEAFRVLSAF